MDSFNRLRRDNEHDGHNNEKSISLQMFLKFDYIFLFLTDFNGRAV
jgi:hypothetical protein